jgi:hypothetical protein
VNEPAAAAAHADIADDDVLDGLDTATRYEQPRLTAMRQ